jgi:DNA repair exonuclease SbcCD ATPase subunit
LGWFSKIFGNSKSEPEEIKQKKALEIDFNGIGNYLNGKSAEIFKPFEKDVKNIYTKIQTATIELDRSLNTLEKTGINQKVDPQLLVLIISHRKSLINKMQNVVNVLETPETLTYESVLEFYNKSSSALDYASSKSIVDYEHVKILFERQLLEVVERIKVLDWLLKDLRYPLDNRKEFFEKLKGCSSTAKEVAKKLAALASTKTDSENTEAAIVKLREELGNVENEIKNILDSEGWKELEGKEKDLGEIESKVSEVKNEILQNISPLEKSFRKFAKLVEDGTVQFEDKKYLWDYLNDGLNTLTKNDLSKFYSLLPVIKREIEKNTIEIKVDKREKTVEIIDSMIENKFLSEMLGRLKVLEVGRQSLEAELQELKKLRDKKGELERKQNIVMNKVAENESLSKELISKIEKIEKEIEMKKSEIENNLAKIIEKNIKIKM